jgi:quercetin dioxygenase-like cupin family protein
VQREGGDIEEIHPGDVVWFEAGEKHWHGAHVNYSDDAISLSRKTLMVKAVWTGWRKLPMISTAKLMPANKSL